jgi:CRISPR-associated protein Cmr3
MPLDLVQKKKLSRSEKVRVEDYSLYPSVKLGSKVLNIASSMETILGKEVLTIEEDVERENDTFITDDAFKNYLKAKSINDVYQFNPKSEAKIGIARNNDTRTTSEGNLYRVGMLRTNNLTIWVEFDELPLPLEKEGLMQLGGERKLVRYKTPRVANPPHSNIELENLSIFKLCLTTPAIFKNGYYPIEIFKKANVEVELISCVIGKHLNIGGFDMIKKEPKEMFKAVPSGSVYYFKLTSGKLSDLDSKIKAVNICEEREIEGFGVAFIGQI